MTTRAERIMQSLNPHALVAEEGGLLVAIEDVKVDGRYYRLECRSTPDGRHALAWCLKNPWGGRNGGESFAKGHVDSDGFLCLGPDHGNRKVQDSPYDLEFTVKRARYWCTAFSALKETGTFPNL